MKRTSKLACGMLLASLIAPALLRNPAAAQTPAAVPVPGLFSGITLSLAQPPSQVPTASAGLVGNPGPQVYFYWIVSNDLIGASAPAGPFLMTSGPNTLSASNYVQLSWAAAPAAITYDVLRTTTPGAPTGACNCAVATGLTTTTANDQSNALAAYTVAQFNPAALNWTITNAQSAAGVSKLSFGVNGAEEWSVDSTGAMIVSSLSAKAMEGVQYAEHFAGADAGAQIEACIAALGSAGGVCDARALTGSQHISENMFAGESGPVRLRLGQATFIVSAQQVITQWTEISGDVHGGTILDFSPTSGTMFTWNTPLGPGGDGAGPLQTTGQGLDHITAYGPGNAYNTTAVLLGGSQGAVGVVIRACRFTFFGTIIKFADNAYWDSIEDSTLEWFGSGGAIMVPSGLTNSGENVMLLHDFIADSPANGYGVSIGSGGFEIEAVSTSFDELTNTIQLTSAAGGSVFSCSGCHFETQASAFINAAAGDVSLLGGQALFDATSGTASSMFIVSGSAAMAIQGCQIQTLGVIVTDMIANTTAGVITVANDDIATGNFINIGAGPFGSQYFGNQRLGIEGVAAANGGIIAGQNGSFGQCMTFVAFGSDATTPQLCNRTGSDATELDVLSGSTSVLKINSAGLTMPATYLTGGSTIAEPSSSGTLAVLSQLPLSGTTDAIGGSSLAAGACVTGSASVTGATTSMVASASPAADPGGGFVWEAWVSAADTVTVRLCNVTSGSLTPTAEVYNVRVVQ